MEFSWYDYHIIKPSLENGVYPKPFTDTVHIELLQNMSLKQRCCFFLHDRKQLARLVELVMIGSTN
jgi:hypothetical protein